MIYDLILYICRVYFNNIGVKSLYSDYSNKKVLLGIQQFILEYFININQVLLNTKLAGVIILVEKLR